MKITRKYIQQKIIEQVLKKNSFTFNLLELFIINAKKCTDQDKYFYVENLYKVMEIRKQLMKESIVIIELEEIFKNPNYVRFMK